MQQKTSSFEGKKDLSFTHSSERLKTGYECKTIYIHMKFKFEFINNKIYRYIKCETTKLIHYIIHKHYFDSEAHTATI